MEEVRQWHGHGKRSIREFEKLCGYQSTQHEICWWFGGTDKTLNAWCKRTYHMSFSEVFRQKRGMGLISLRRMQFQLAAKSAAMAIFLGKQHLGQQDVQKQEISGGMRFVWGGDEDDHDTDSVSSGTALEGDDSSGA